MTIWFFEGGCHESRCGRAVQRVHPLLPTPHTMIILAEEDRGSFYFTQNFEGFPALAWKDNGDCIYLADGKCSIYEQRPTMCRAFDCRGYYKMILAKGPQLGFDLVRERGQELLEKEEADDSKRHHTNRSRQRF